MHKAATFKNAVRQDLRAFLNPFEFSEVHIINGKRMNALVDDSELLERKKREEEHMDGMHVRQLLIYVEEEEYGPLPAPGRIVLMDGRRYRVVDAVDEGGVYSLTLEANAS